MNTYLIYDSQGVVVQSVSSKQEEAAALAFILGAGYIQDTADTGFKYIDLSGDAPIVRCAKAQPTEWHVMDPLTGSWVFEQSSLPDLISTKHREIDSERDRQRTRGVVYNGVLFDSDQISTANIVSWAAAVANSIPVPAGFTWRSLDNRDIPFSAADILGLSSAALMRGKALECQWPRMGCLDCPGIST